MDRRAFKQLVIAGIALLIGAAAAFAAWRVAFYEFATCTDTIQNQDEVGVDCGGVCAPCVGIPEEPRLVQEPVFVVSDGGTYDAMFRVENVNPQWGAKELPYRLFFENEAGKAIAERNGTTFLLPLEERAIVVQTIALSGAEKPTRGRVEFGEPVWVEVPDRAQGDDLVVLNTVFHRLENQPEFAEVRGVVRNDAPFTYDRIEVHVLLFDHFGDPVGLRSTEMRTLSAGELREFRIAWRAPLMFAGEPEVTIDAATNVFQNENFVRKHGTRELFQESR